MLITTKEARDKIRENYQTMLPLPKEHEHVKIFMAFLDDIDTLELQNARLREAVKIARASLSALSRFVEVDEYSKGEIISVVRGTERIAEQALSTVDTLLKSEDKE